MGETTNAGDKGATDAAGSNPAVPSPQQPKIEIDSVDLSKQFEMKTSGALPPAPIVAPAKPAHEVDEGVQNDIARILGSVKLPDRNAPVAPQPKDPKGYDTQIGASSVLANAERAALQAHVRDAALAVNDSLGAATSHSSDNVRALHTLKDDLQDVVHNQKISVVRAAALQEEKRHRSGSSLIPPDEFAPPVKARRTAPVVATLILFLVGAGALAGTYLILQNRSVDAIAPVPSGLLFAEQTVPLPLDTLAPTDVRREVANARGAGALSLGAILQVRPTLTQRDARGNEVNAPVSFGLFMNRIGAAPPDQLVRALSDDFFFGIHTVDENAPLFVIPVQSYEHAFAGMLEWEKTMNSDLAPMFAAVPMQTVGPDGVIVERVFTDAVIQNYDVRVLRDENGTVQLYYSFPTRNILIIAESQYSFPELLSRLRADRRL